MLRAEADGPDATAALAPTAPSTVPKWAWTGKSHVFDALDLDGDGRVSRDELIQAVGRNVLDSTFCDLSAVTPDQREEAYESGRREGARIKAAITALGDKLLEMGGGQPPPWCMGLAPLVRPGKRTVLRVGFAPGSDPPNLPRQFMGFKVVLVERSPGQAGSYGEDTGNPLGILLGLGLIAGVAYVMFREGFKLRGRVDQTVEALAAQGVSDEQILKSTPDVVAQLGGRAGIEKILSALEGTLAPTTLMTSQQMAYDVLSGKVSGGKAGDLARKAFADLGSTKGARSMLAAIYSGGPVDGLTPLAQRVAGVLKGKLGTGEAGWETGMEELPAAHAAFTHPMPAQAPPSSMRLNLGAREGAPVPPPTQERPSASLRVPTSVPEQRPAPRFIPLEPKPAQRPAPRFIPLEPKPEPKPAPRPAPRFIPLEPKPAPRGTTPPVDSRPGLGVRGSVPPPESRPGVGTRPGLGVRGSVPPPESRPGVGTRPGLGVRGSVPVDSRPGLGVRGSVPPPESTPAAPPNDVRPGFGGGVRENVSPPLEYGGVRLQPPTQYVLPVRPPFQPGVICRPAVMYRPPIERIAAPYMVGLQPSVPVERVLINGLQREPYRYRTDVLLYRRNPVHYNELLVRGYLPSQVYDRFRLNPRLVWLTSGWEPERVQRLISLYVQQPDEARLFYQRWRRQRDWAAAERRRALLRALIARLAAMGVWSELAPLFDALTVGYSSDQRDALRRSLDARDETATQAQFNQIESANQAASDAQANGALQGLATEASTVQEQSGALTELDKPMDELDPDPVVSFFQTVNTAVSVGEIKEWIATLAKSGIGVAVPGTVPPDGARVLGQDEVTTVVDWPYQGKGAFAFVMPDVAKSLGLDAPASCAQPPSGAQSSGSGAQPAPDAPAKPADQAPPAAPETGGLANGQRLFGLRGADAGGPTKRIYVIKPGDLDNLMGLAATAGVGPMNLGELTAANPGKTPANVKVGDVINIPDSWPDRPGMYQLAPSDTGTPGGSPRIERVVFLEQLDPGGATNRWRIWLSNGDVRDVVRSGGKPCVGDYEPVDDVPITLGLVDPMRASLVRGIDVYDAGTVSAAGMDGALAKLRSQIDTIWPWRFKGPLDGIQNGVLRITVDNRILPVADFLGKAQRSFSFGPNLETIAALFKAVRPDPRTANAALSEWNPQVRYLEMDVKPGSGTYAWDLSSVPQNNPIRRAPGAARNTLRGQLAARFPITATIIGFDNMRSFQENGRDVLSVYGPPRGPDPLLLRQAVRADPRTESTEVIRFAGPTDETVLKIVFKAESAQNQDPSPWDLSVLGAPPSSEASGAVASSGINAVRLRDAGSLPGGMTFGGPPLAARYEQMADTGDVPAPVARADASTLVVVVTDESGKAVPGALVRAIQTRFPSNYPGASPDLGQRLTDMTGIAQFVVAGREGSFAVAVEAPGFPPTYKSVSVGSGDIVPLRFRLSGQSELTVIRPETGGVCGEKHVHKCGECGCIWRHATGLFGQDAAHQCPGCGAMQWWKCVDLTRRMQGDTSAPNDAPFYFRGLVSALDARNIDLVVPGGSVPPGSMLVEDSGLAFDDAVEEAFFAVLGATIGAQVLKYAVKNGYRFAWRPGGPKKVDGSWRYPADPSWRIVPVDMAGTDTGRGGRGGRGWGGRGWRGGGRRGWGRGGRGPWGWGGWWGDGPWWWYYDAPPVYVLDDDAGAPDANAVAAYNGPVLPWRGTAAAFKALDANGDGMVDHGELHAGLGRTGVALARFNLPAHPQIPDGAGYQWVSGMRWIVFPSREAKARYMADAARHDAHDPQVLSWANQFAGIEDPYERAQAILRFVQLGIRYEHDPAWYDERNERHGIELLDSSAVGFNRGYGDCDLKARMFVALALASGLDADISPVFVGENGFPHVRASVRIDGQKLVADPTIVNSDIGRLPMHPKITATSDDDVGVAPGTRTKAA